MNINILPKLNGKYIYKTFRLITFWVVLPVTLILTILFIFLHKEY